MPTNSGDTATAAQEKEESYRLGWIESWVTGISSETFASSKMRLPPRKRQRTTRGTSPGPSTVEPGISPSPWGAYCEASTTATNPAFYDFMPVNPGEISNGPQALEASQESLDFVKEHVPTFVTSLEEIIGYTNQTRACVPGYARDKTDVPIPEHDFQSEEEERSLADLEYELREIQNSIRNTKHCRVNGVDESTWNTRVHAKIFDIAAHNSKNVGVYSLGSVVVPDAWRPRISRPRTLSGRQTDTTLEGGSEQSRSPVTALSGPRIVDFVDFLLYLEDSKRTERIIELLKKESLRHRTANHFDENALALFPAGVFVRTKGPKGTKQMRSWISSWHIRMSSFFTG